MNDAKLKNLFASARTETPPVPPPGFDAQVLRALRRESRLAPISLWDQLDALFPRLTIASALLIGFCFVSDYCYSAAHPAGLAAEVNDVSEQWLFAANGN